MLPSFPHPSIFPLSLSWHLTLKIAVGEVTTAELVAFELFDTTKLPDSSANVPESFVKMKQPY